MILQRGDGRQVKQVKSEEVKYCLEEVVIGSGKQSG